MDRDRDRAAGAADAVLRSRNGVGRFVCRFTPAGTRGKSARRMPDTVPCFGAFRRTVPGGGNAVSFAGRWPFRFLHLFFISVVFLSFGPVRNRSGVHEAGKRGGAPTRTTGTVRRRMTTGRTDPANAGEEGFSSFARRE